MRRSTSQPLNLSPLLADTFETSGWLSSHAKLQISYQSDVAQHVNTLSENANLIIRIIAIVSSSLSVLTGLVAIYFFHRMEKRYRHKYHSNGTIYVFFNTDLIPARLIVFNISGDILRALWYLIFCSASLAGYDAPDHSALCQMTGYFLSVGYEVTDLTVLFIAIHGAMQVYTPIVDPHDPRYGLNPYRYYVNTVLLVLPVILASLAFINPEGGYANGVSVCWLPIRPIWYQLALSWLPRYIIFLIVSVLSIAVYAHVGHQFRSFRNAWSSHLKLIPDKQSIPPVSLPSEPDRPKKVSFSQGPPTIWDGSRRRTRRDERRLSLPDASLLSPTASETAKITRFASNRRHTEDMGYTSNEQTLSSIPLETHEDVQYVKALWQNTPDVQASSEGRRESLVTNGTVWSTASDRPTQNIPILPSIICSNDQLIQPVHGPSSPDLERGLSESATQNLVEARRQTMIKQMRVNFVYPIVYITLWTTPFVLHCLQYSEKYANNPPPVLIAMSTLCIPSMGFANAVCFLIREKPWLEVGLWPEWVLQKFQNSNGGATKDLVGIKPGHSSSVSMDVSIIGTSLSSRSSSFNSRAAQLSQQDKMSAEYPNSLPIGYARPWSAKNKALERLALERQDRRRQMQIILRGSEGIEDASTTESTKTPLVYRTSGSEAKRYWWEETDQSSSTRPFSNEPQQQDDKENIGSLVHETDLNAS